MLARHETGSCPPAAVVRTRARGEIPALLGEASVAEAPASCNVPELNTGAEECARIAGSFSCRGFRVHG